MENLISDYAVTYSRPTFRNKYQPHFLQFFHSVSFNRNRTAFAATTHGSWALNAPKMRLWP